MADRNGEGLGSRHFGSERWTFIVPVDDLVLTKAVSREFKMERATFVHQDRLTYVRKKHGLAAAIEFKPQVGPSFGNNFNNRIEEAVGSAQDLWTAYREGGFGTSGPGSDTSSSSKMPRSPLPL